MSDNLKKPVENRPFENEFIIQTSRSSGPGGQHVNKTETKVELRFHIDDSKLLTDEEKETLKEKLKRRVNADGYLLVFAQERRSQLMNKQLAEKRFYQYLVQALKKRKKRVPTKPTKQAVEKRISSKKIRGEKKVYRSRIRIKGEEKTF
ncbi:MAG: aminoacyl-tRNA hydrolase [Bacteroidales bacterium]|nr:aminoacyl-tRNA hydrolase [Bacteroidales bacterium]